MMQIIAAGKRHKSFIVDCQINMAFETEHMTLDRETVEDGVGHVLAESSTGFYLIAEYKQVPLACMMVLYEWSDWRSGQVLWIHSLYVLPKYRRKGMFEGLYNYLKEMVQSSEQYKGIRLYVDKRNEGAIKAYQKAGMTNEHYELFEWLK